MKSLVKLYFSMKRKPKIEKTDRIAVIKTGAIGDVLMSTPMLRALRKAKPEAEITYIVGRQSASVLEKNPNIDRILVFDVFDALGKNFRSMYKFAKELQKEQFDIALVLDKSYLAGIFAAVCRIPVRIGFDRYGEGFANTHNVKYSKVRHEIDYYIDLLRFLKIKPCGRKMDFSLDNKDRAFVNEFFKKNKINGKKVCVAPSDTRDPGGVISTRMWPDVNYAHIVNWVVKNGNTVFFLGSKTDRNKAGRIRKLSDVDTYSVVGKTNIREAAAFMELCDLVITHDAGPMHVSAAVGTPVISIFGPTDPRRKAPPGSVALWKGSSCTKCEVIGTFPYCARHPKTTDITAEEVIKKSGRFLK